MNPKYCKALCNNPTVVSFIMEAFSNLFPVSNSSSEGGTRRKIMKDAWRIPSLESGIKSCKMSRISRILGSLRHRFCKNFKFCSRKMVMISRFMMIQQNSVGLIPDPHRIDPRSPTTRPLGKFWEMEEGLNRRCAVSFHVIKLSTLYIWYCPLLQHR